MEENLRELCEKHLPKWLQDENRTIFTKFIKIRPNITFIAVILVSGQYYELLDREILRECSLEANTGNFLTSEGVSMDIFYSYGVENTRRIFYLIKIGEKLFVVERLNNSLSVRMMEESVLSVDIEDKSGEGNPAVLITKTDGSVRETNFTTQDLVDAEDEIEPSIFLLNYLESHNRKLESCLEMRRCVIREELHKIHNVGKYGPQEIHDGASDEAAPLVKYGEVWVKFHNDRIVFGIPVFNTTYTRRRVALNVRPSLATTQLDRFSYEFKLYKIRNDSCTFENVEELFDYEEPSYANSCDFQHEWMPLEENNLQPGMSAILVANTQVMDFSNISTFKFIVYVQYEINHEGKVFSLQLMAGEVEITPEIFFKPLFGTEIRERNFFYRNLVAIASTSSFKVVYVDGGSKISQRFYRFLMEDLKFHQITHPQATMASSEGEIEGIDEVSMREELVEDVEMKEVNADESHFMATDMFSNQKRPTIMFYQLEGFWRGGLIRIQENNECRLKLKLYMRTDNHFACFLGVIKTTFGCKVTLTDEKNVQDTCLVIQSLIEEINCKKQLLKMLPVTAKDGENFRESLKDIFRKELKTDYVFNKLADNSSTNTGKKDSETVGQP